MELRAPGGLPAVAVLLALVANAPSAYACPYYGQVGSRVRFVGERQGPSSTPGAVFPYITYDNPSPVSTTSSIWNMLTVYGGINTFARVGWIHYNGSSSP